MSTIEYLDAIDRDGQLILQAEHLFSRAMFDNILSRDTFCASEIDIFEALLRWASFNLPDNKQTPKDKRQYLGELLFKVRFPQMTMKTIMTRVATTGLLEPSELIDALNHTMGKKATICAIKFPKAIRSQGLEFVLRASDIPVDPEHLGGTLRFERAISNGHRVLRIQLQQRLFIKKVCLRNVPYHLSDPASGHQLVIIISDMTNDEVLKVSDFKLTHEAVQLPLPESYNLQLDPTELRSQIIYEISVSVEAPQQLASRTVKRTGISFKYFGQIDDSDVIIDSMTFLS